MQLCRNEKARGTETATVHAGSRARHSFSLAFSHRRAKFARRWRRAASARSIVCDATAAPTCTAPGTAEMRERYGATPGSQLWPGTTGKRSMAIVTGTYTHCYWNIRVQALARMIIIWGKMLLPGPRFWGILHTRSTGLRHCSGSKMSEHQAI